MQAILELITLGAHLLERWVLGTAQERDQAEAQAKAAKAAATSVRESTQAAHDARQADIKRELDSTLDKMAAVALQPKPEPEKK